MATPDEFYKLKEKALRLLARRDHSAYELKVKLKQRAPLTEDDFKKLIEYLKDLGYMVNENQLSLRWIKQWRSEGRGRNWISGKLRSKGLPSIDLRDDDDELESARLFINKKFHGSIEKIDYKEKARVARSMISRGFSGSVVATVLKDLNQEMDV